MCETASNDKPYQDIDPRKVHLRRNERGQLVFQAGPQSEPIIGVRVARCFPWSMPDRYISIRNDQGDELFLFQSLDQAEPQTRRLIEEELELLQFVPQITTVESVDDQFEVMSWKVQTDRGPVELQVKHAEDIRQLDEKRVLIRDHAGGLFEVRDITKLDPRSRRFIEDYSA